MNIRVENIVLEITRRCNMKCMHCCRGQAQKLDMTPEIMNQVLNQIDHIGTVIFTGGEPSLNIPLIEHFTQVCRSKKIAGRDYAIGPDYFYVVTNGKKNSKALADALVDLYDICDEMGGRFDEGLGGLCMSRDQYHDEGIAIPRIFKALSFFREDEHAKEIEYVINEGRAELNGLQGGREASNHPFEADQTDNVLNVSEMLYISANGNVSSDCDLSFKHADETCFGNVLDRPLIDIIMEHRKED